MPCFFILFGMNSIMISFFITSMAGLSTMLGIVPIYWKRYQEGVVLPVCLMFASGVMLTISFCSLIPEAFSLIRENNFLFPSVLLVLIFIVIGILFSSKISKKIEEKFSSNYLYRLGLISVIALCFHNLPEGIMTFLSSNHDLSLGISLSLGIALHNIPEGISVAIPIYYATHSKKKAIFYTFISGFSELLGAVIAYLFLSPILTSFILGVILAIAAGIMIYISFYELIPTAFRYPVTGFYLLSFLLGIGVMSLCHFFL